MRRRGLLALALSAAGRRALPVRRPALRPLANWPLATWPLATAPLAAAATLPAPSPMSPRALAFPRDHGAHPERRIEWWYLTGWLYPAGPVPPAGETRGALGVQLTFFRARSGIDPRAPGAFAAHQVVIAHAALADPAAGRLLHDQRIARTGFGLAYADEGDTAVGVDRWAMRRGSDGAYRCRVDARGFALELVASPSQALLLQGEQGWSRKGPAPEQASFYYSQPHLALRATLERDGRTLELAGLGWLDHEWTDRVLDEGALGWDWVGFNLDDGSALTAFVIRARSAGDAPPPSLYGYAAWRPRGGPTRVFPPAAVRFEPLRHWSSPHTRARYPVAQRIVVGGRSFETRPLFDDQELDSRASTGAVYWEGASVLLEDGRPVGRGYLEMTGRVSPMVI